jgi:hypothetical protein
VAGVPPASITKEPTRPPLQSSEFPHFPRNLALVSVLYIGERPEMIFSQRGIKEGQNKKRKLLYGKSK